MAQRSLKDQEIQEVLYEDIPDGDSFCGGDSEDDEERVVIFDVSPYNSPQPSDEEEDDVPLSQLASIPATSEHAVHSSTSRSDNDIPKWKKSYHMSEPGEFSETTSLPRHILNLAEYSPHQLFCLFWTNEWQEAICFQTNLYAIQKGVTYATVTKQELDVFIALNLVMGIKKSPSYKDYWSSGADLHDPYISSFMPLNRFGWLLNHLHLNDNSLMPQRGSAQFDKLYKVRPLLDHMKQKFKEHYTCTEKVAIDESMVKFTGRSSLKQYMPKKPIKRGYKVWMKCASTGYCLDFDLYAGKDGDKVQTDLGGKVVRQFCEGLQGKNHKVYFDNYFNGYQLQRDLYQQSILACGTVNSTRKYLPALKDDKQLHRGEYDYRVSNTNVSIMKWKDKRSVHILSNFHDPRDVGVVCRRERDGSSVEVTCPQAVIDYNKNMNYVDYFDQLKSYYSIDRRSRKWWHRIFFHFLDCSVINAYILYKDLQALPNKDLEAMNLKMFRRRVYQGILAPAVVAGRKRALSLSSTPRSSPTPAAIQNHKPVVPVEIRMQQSKHKPIRSTSRRCAKCSTKGNPVRTIYICETCKVPLCLRKGKTCFNDFHDIK